MDLTTALLIGGAAYLLFKKKADPRVEAMRRQATAFLIQAKGLEAMGDPGGQAAMLRAQADQLIRAAEALEAGR